jgi:hypothetical protein
MKESKFIKLNFKFEISNFCANVKVKITSFRTAVWQLANTLTVREFKKRTVTILASKETFSQIFFHYKKLHTLRLDNDA